MDTLSLCLDTFAPIARRPLLDVGCGHGALARRLVDHGARVTGIDPNPDAIAAAREAVPEARFEAAPAEALPFADGAFDGAVCLNALHHTADPDTALAEMARVVAPGAAIVVIEPLAQGSFFAVLRPIEDETAVRAAAQDAIARGVASGAFACAREIVFERLERFATLERFIARVVAVDPARAEAARLHRPAIEAAFDAAGRDESGRRVLVQPLRAHVLIPVASQPA